MVILDISKKKTISAKGTKVKTSYTILTTANKFKLGNTNAPKRQNKTLPWR